MDIDLWPDESCGLSELTRTGETSSQVLSQPLSVENEVRRIKTLDSLATINRHTHTNLYFTRIRIMGVRKHKHIVLFVLGFSSSTKQKSGSMLVPKNNCMIMHVFSVPVCARVPLPCKEGSWDRLGLASNSLAVAWSLVKKNVENLQARAHGFSLGSWFGIS